MEFAGLAYALLAADAVRLTSLRGRQDSGQEGYECANDQDAAKRDGSMQSAIGTVCEATAWSPKGSRSMRAGGVGKHLDEPTIYRGALAFDQVADWKKM